MILQSLVEYYVTLVAQHKVDPQGWSAKRVSYALSLDNNGNVVDVISLVDTDPTDRESPQTHIIPTPQKRASGIAANYLCENSTYFLGVDEKGRPKRAKECFEAAKVLHHEILADTQSKIATAILSYFDTWKPENAENHVVVSPHLANLVKGANIVFMVDGEFAHQDRDIKKAWDRYYQQREMEADTGQCLVTGQYGPITRLHPSIKGVDGAQSTGGSIVSFNATAYESHGKKQGLNSPVSTYASFAYGEALNALLSDREHRQVLGDTTMVFWSETGEAVYQDITMAGLSSTDTDDPQEELRSAIRSLSQGKAIDFQGVTVEPETPFYILGLAPNAARISVRFFLHNTFGHFMENLESHFNRLEIIRPNYDKVVLPSVWQLLNETVNQKATRKKPKPQLAGDVIKAILNGTRYPDTLYLGVQERIRADGGDVRPNRAAIIKGFLTKNIPDDQPIKEVLTVALNEQTDYTPYVLGRLFSVLEAIQQDANPGINTTIKDRYFTAASGTPATVFPLLVNLAQSHLRKLIDGSKIFYNRMIQELLGKINSNYPRFLSLYDRGAFQLGYYHQTQKRFQKKKDKEKGGEKDD